LHAPKNITLATRIECHPLGPQICHGGIVRVTIGFDFDSDEPKPTVAIDGQVLAWSELGQTVST